MDVEDDNHDSPVSEFYFRCVPRGALKRAIVKDVTKEVKQALATELADTP
jgi:hypothetical protein